MIAVGVDVVGLVLLHCSLCAASHVYLAQQSHNVSYRSIGFILAMEGTFAIVPCIQYCLPS